MQNSFKVLTIAVAAATVTAALQSGRMLPDLNYYVAERNQPK
jgi:hypothetical protein